MSSAAKSSQQSMSVPELWSTGEKGSFAERTAIVRLPKMVRSVMASNKDRFSEDILKRLEILAMDMENGHLIESGSYHKSPNKTNKNYEFMNEWIQQFEQKLLNKKWNNAPFYWMEAFLFRIILEKCDYFEKDSKYYKMDPFERLKLREAFRSDVWAQLEASLKYVNDTSSNVSLEDRLFYAITCDLWANKVDLNFKPGSQEELTSESEHKSMDDHLLADNRRDVIKFLLQHKEQLATGSKRNISFICDNSGAEFLNDLLFVDFLLSNGFAPRVCLHLKYFPTYVSDVTIRDFDNHMTWICVQALQNSNDSSVNVYIKQFYDRLCEYIKNGQLEVVHDHFWNSIHMFDALPKELISKYFDPKLCALVISKGDANYRRLVLAAKWEPDLALNKVLSYFPTNCLALRTMKSDAVCGIDSKVVEEVEKTDADWRHNGKRGLIQFYTKE